MQADVVVIGSGIVGLAAAYAAYQRGHQVLVLDKDAACTGASVRNFGFVTVTGQSQSLTWNRAMLARNIWSEIAPQAGIETCQQGLWVLAQRPEAVRVLQELMAQPQGQQLQWHSAQQLRQWPSFRSADLLGGLYSPHELRFEALLAIAKLRKWLESLGVAFKTGVHAHFEPSLGLFANGEQVHFNHMLAAPGPDLVHWVPHWLQVQQIKICRLLMLRVQPPAGYVLPAPIMSDLSLVRYKGYTELKSSSPLLERLQSEQAEHLEHGIHLIVVQNPDGSLTVGDSHHYHQGQDPFVQHLTEQLILQEMQSVLKLPDYQVIERWVGFYPSGTSDAHLIELSDRAQLITVTSGTGMSTGFALAQEWAEKHL